MNSLQGMSLVLVCLCKAQAGCACSSDSWCGRCLSIWNGRICSSVGQVSQDAVIPGQ